MLRLNDRAGTAPRWRQTAGMGRRRFPAGIPFPFDMLVLAVLLSIAGAVLPRNALAQGPVAGEHCDPERAALIDRLQGVFGDRERDLIKAQDLRRAAAAELRQARYKREAVAERVQIAEQSLAFDIQDARQRIREIAGLMSNMGWTVSAGAPFRLRNGQQIGRPRIDGSGAQRTAATDDIELQLETVAESEQVLLDARAAEREAVRALDIARYNVRQTRLRLKEARAAKAAARAQWRRALLAPCDPPATPADPLAGIDPDDVGDDIAEIERDRKARKLEADAENDAENTAGGIAPDFEEFWVDVLEDGKGPEIDPDAPWVDIGTTGVETGNPGASSEDPGDADYSAFLDDIRSGAIAEAGDVTIYELPAEAMAAVQEAMRATREGSGIQAREPDTSGAGSAGRPGHREAMPGGTPEPVSAGPATSTSLPEPAAGRPLKLEPVGAVPQPQGPAKLMPQPSGSAVPLPVPKGLGEVDDGAAARSLAAALKRAGVSEDRMAAAAAAASVPLVRRACSYDAAVICLEFAHLEDLDLRECLRPIAAARSQCQAFGDRQSMPLTVARCQADCETFASAAIAGGVIYEHAMLSIDGAAPRAQRKLADLERRLARAQALADELNAAIAARQIHVYVHAGTGRIFRHDGPWFEPKPPLHYSGTMPYRPSPRQAGALAALAMESAGLQMRMERLKRELEADPLGDWRREARQFWQRSSGQDGPDGCASETVVRDRLQQCRDHCAAQGDPSENSPGASPLDFCRRNGGLLNAMSMPQTRDWIRPPDEL